MENTLPYQAKLSQKIKDDPIAFVDEFLGILPHPGQRRWIRESQMRLISILRPGNKFGKTMVEALLHIWEAVTKPRIAGKVWSEDEWMRVQYQTLVFGPTYEQSRELLGMIIEMVQGNMIISVCPYCDSHRINKKNAKDSHYKCLMCGKIFTQPKSRTNHSMLKDWAIEIDHSSSQLLPSITWFNRSQTLGRSYDEMGKAFKMKALAYITGDECADIAELYTFTSNTLLPRLFTMNGSIHFVGTPQPGGLDYVRMIEMAEDDMRRKDWKTKGQMYTQKGSIYENIFVDAEYIAKIEQVADPDLRRQIIDGEVVEIGDKFFGHDRIHNMVDKELRWIDYGVPGRKYLVSVDFAFGSSVWADYTVIMVFDYTNEPWQVVHFKRFKASEVPVPIQYDLVRETIRNFPGRLIIDSSGPGGKSAAAFLRDVHPINFEAGPTGPNSSKKEQGLTSLKTAMDGGDSVELRRKVLTMESGKVKDLNPRWGLVRIPNDAILISELSSYKLQDKKLRTDCVMAMMMAVDWLMMRRPKQVKNRAMELDLLTAGWGQYKPRNPSPYERRVKAVDIDLG